MDVRLEHYIITNYNLKLTNEDLKKTILKQDFIINEKNNKIKELENFNFNDIFENLEIGDGDFQKIVNKFKNLINANKELNLIINEKNRKIKELEDLLYNDNLIDDFSYDPYENNDYDSDSKSKSNSKSNSDSDSDIDLIKGMFYNTTLDESDLLFDISDYSYSLNNNNDKFKKIKILGDGNCQYRSIEYFLKVPYKQLKMNALRYIQENKEYFSDFIFDFNEYMDYMEQDNTYGDEITLMAMALDNDIIINVYDLNYEIINNYGLLGSSEFESETKINIIYNKIIKHYDVLLIK
jgi:hypothetical protein